MVQSNQVRELLRKRPFQPFRVYLNDGRVFEVRYPDTNLLGQNYFSIGIVESDEPDPFAEYSVLVLLEEIQRLEPMNPAGSSTRPVTDRKEETPMVQPDELRPLLRQRPFQPFRVHLNDGRVFDIRYPDTTLLGQNFFSIGIVESDDDPHPFADYSVLVSLDEIERVEPLNSADSAASA